jgi:phosphoglycolate phosphatase
LHKRIGASLKNHYPHRANHAPAFYSARGPTIRRRAGRIPSQRQKTPLIGVRASLIDCGMMDPAPVLVFDLDGTLAETAGDLIGTLNVIMAREGLAPVPLASARSLLGAGARALIARGFANAGRSLEPDKLQQLFSAFLDHYNAHIADNSWLFPGVEAALTHAAAAGCKLAVCTNKLEHSSHLLLGKLGIADRFQFVCGQDTYGVAKPDPTPLIETIARVAGAGAFAIMIGDSRTDIDTARAAGVPVIAVDFGYTDVPVAQLHPDRVIGHFDQLWAAVGSIVAEGRASVSPP